MRSGLPDTKTIAIRTEEGNAIPPGNQPMRPGNGSFSGGSSHRTHEILDRRQFPWKNGRCLGKIHELCQVRRQSWSNPCCTNHCIRKLGWMGCRQSHRGQTRSGVLACSRNTDCRVRIDEHLRSTVHVCHRGDRRRVVTGPPVCRADTPGSNLLRAVGANGLEIRDRFTCYCGGADSTLLPDQTNEHSRYRQ